MMQSRITFTAAAAAVLAAHVCTQGIQPVNIDVELYPTSSTGQQVPDDIRELVALNFSRHDTEDIAFLTSDQDLFLLTAPSIHQEYILLASGVTAVAALPGGASSGSDALVVSTATGLHLLEPGTSTAISSATSMQAATRILVGSCDADSDLDIVVVGSSGDLVSLLLDNGSWTLGASTTMAGPVCDLEIAPKWRDGTAPILYVVAEEVPSGQSIAQPVVHALDPLGSLADYFSPLSLGTAVECVQVECIREADSENLAIAWTQFDFGASAFQSWVMMAMPAPSSQPYGFTAGVPVMLRRATLRGMWSGSYVADDYTDVLLAFDDNVYPDLYLNGNRGGSAGTFYPAPGYAACLIMSSNPPATETGWVFADIDGDGQAEFGYGTESGTSDHELAFAESPLPEVPVPPVVDYCVGLATGDSFGLAVDLGVALSEGATHVEAFAWALDWDSGLGSVFTSRDAPAHASVSAAGGGWGNVVFSGLDPGWDDAGYYVVLRHVVDAVPGGEFEEYGATSRFRVYRNLWSPSLGTAYEAAVEAIGTPNGESCDTGAIPLIIDPVQLPPVPPIPPVVTQTVPPVGG